MKKEVGSSARSTFSLPIMVLLLLGSFVLPSFNLSRSQAHAAAPITPSGLNTQVNLAPIPPAGKTQYDITGGTRPGGGTNLFHSFGDFNVPNNNIANFLNDSGLATSNILGRVTGGNISNIFGTIQTTGFGNANLFMMNPAGFLFGPNATVNVGGMVAFTTADYLRLADGARFNAIPNAAADTLLSAAPVAAFGFLGSNPGAITVQGSQLSVTPGQSISLVGGNITVQSGVLDDGTTVQPARLSAPGGQINLASVASPGEILLSSLQSAPNINGQSFTAMGNISLSQGALLDVSADAAGTVRIRGGQLVIADATISADTNNANGAPTAVDINISGDLSITDTRGVPAITARTTGSGNAGEVLISSGNFSASTTFSDPNFFFHTLIDTHTAGTGAGGSINISTGDLKITGNPLSTILTFIDTGTQGDGRGGDVTINAQTIEMTGATISTGTFTADVLNAQGVLPDLPIGSAGNLTINANTFIGDNAHFSTAGDSSIGSNQHAGDITLNVRNFHFTNNSSADLTGDFGGGVTITADTFIMDASAIQAFTLSGPGNPIIFNGRVLELNNGSTLTTSTFGDGTAGDIRVSASDHVGLIGRTGPDAFVNSNPTGIFSNSQGFFGQGAAGNIVITTPRLTMDQGKINTTTLSSGGGGNVTINANVVEMSGDFPGEFTGDFFFFNVGNVHPSGIFTQTIGSDFCVGPCGNAGNINITTGSLVMGAGSQINSGTTNTGKGGDITIHATDQISISGTLSDGSPVGIFSRTDGTDPGSGIGGNIELHASQFQVTNGAQISASTLGTGNAGNVTIQGLASPAQSVLIDGTGSGIFTDTQGTGAGGNIVVNANTVTLQNGGTLSASTSGSDVSATGGTITVTAPGQMAMTGGSSISASSSGPANAGDISINAGQQLTMQNSSITTEASQASGGNITIQAVELVGLATSKISASVLGGPQTTGGNITIDPNLVILQNSQITANAVQGNGGNISLTTNFLIVNNTLIGSTTPVPASAISASSQFGENGTITVQSPNAPASGKIIPLSQKPLLATLLLTQRCASLAGGEFSSFTVAGRDSLPTEPGGWLASPLAALSADAEPAARGEGQEDTTLGASPAGETAVLSLRRIAPPGFLTQAFAVDWSAGCTS